MLTCGDLGGQACPLLGKAKCPRTGTGHLRPEHQACYPMRMAVRLAVRYAPRPPCICCDEGIEVAACTCGAPPDREDVADMLTWAAEVRDE